MIKIIIALLFWINLVLPQDNCTTFNPQNAFFKETIESIVGSNVKCTLRLSNIDKSEKPRIKCIGIYNQSGQLIKDLVKNIDYADSLEIDRKYNSYILILKFNFKEEIDTPHLLYVHIYMKSVDQEHYDVKNYWIINPKYPISTQINNFEYIPSQSGIFNFSALGLDDVALYSYEVVYNNNIIYSDNGPIVQIENLTSNSDLVDKQVLLRGKYDNSSFKYISHYDKDSVLKSEWKIKITTPDPEKFLKNSSKWVKDPVTQIYRLCLEFWYDINGTIIKPQVSNVSEIDESYWKILIIPLEKEKKTRIQLEPTSQEWARIEGKILLPKFDDQFNKNIQRGFKLSRPK